MLKFEKSHWENLHKDDVCFFFFYKSWKQHTIKQQLYGHLPLLSKTIQGRHAGHCWRFKDELISNIL